MAKSWKAEVIADSSGQWASNGLRFPTKEEAEKYAQDLWARWLLVRQTRATECDDPVTHSYVDGLLTDVQWV